MLTAREVARYLLGSFDQETGDNITNMKLQKLLYYAQGFHAAIHGGEALFPDSIEAWQHGPVVDAVYQEYKECGNQAITPPAAFDPGDYLPETRELLDLVNEVYGQFGAAGLRNLTHREAPWDDAYEVGRRNVIPLPAITDYFTNLIVAGRSGRRYEDHPIWPVERLRHQRRRSIARRFEAMRDRMEGIARVGDAEPNPWGDD